MAVSSGVPLRRRRTCTGTSHVLPWYASSPSTVRIAAKLFLKCAEGSHIKAAWLTAHRGAGKATDYFLKWTFSDLLISSYQAGAAEDIPVDQVSFNFAKIEVEYKPQKPDGSFAAGFKAGWDAKTNKKI